MLLASCSKPRNEIPVYPVKGKLTFDGEPAIGAFLVLHPVGHELPQTVQSKGRVSQDGTFRLATFSDGDGAPEGEYTLTVEWRKLVESSTGEEKSKNVIPKRYLRPETSGLQVEVVAGENNVPTFELQD